MKKGKKNNQIYLTAFKETLSDIHRNNQNKQIHVGSQLVEKIVKNLIK